jgi:hypothetical protein
LRAWPGRYEYVDSAGQTAAGTGIVVTYRLEISNAEPSRAILRIVGFQTDQALRCSISATSGEMTARFLNYEDGGATNEFGVAVYQPGQALFTLEPGKDTRDLVTNWLALKPAGIHGSSGKYFEKARSTSE